MLAPRRGSTAALTVLAVALLTVTSTVALATVFAGTAVFGGTADVQGPGARTHAPTGPFEGPIDLGDANATFSGDPLERVGHAVAVGDVNGDGAADVVLAAPVADRNDPNSGAVYVYYGPFEGGRLNASDANVTLLGAEGDRAGHALAVGDFDGDGVDDYAVGAPRNDSTGRDAGRVYVLRGGDYEGNITLPAAANATIDGAGATDRAGYAVAAVAPTAEATEPTASMLLVGAPANDSESGRNAGAAYLLVDPLAADGSRLDVAANATYVGTHRGEGVGYRVASAGNVSGDNRTELLLGAPRSDRSDANAGTVYVLGTDRRGRVDAASGVVIAGADATDQAGFAVAGAGDTNGDGIDDIVIGAPYHDRNVVNGTAAKPEAGAAYVVHGPITRNLSLDRASVTLNGVAAFDRAGWSVAATAGGGGECDGIDDLLVGAPYADAGGNDSGVAYFVYGNGASIVRELSTAGATFRGTNEKDLAGWAVAGAGDVTGDGSVDVLLSATGADAGGNQSGAAYLVEGDCPVAPATPSTPGATPGANGTTTSTAGGQASVARRGGAYVGWGGLPVDAADVLPVEEMVAAGMG